MQTYLSNLTDHKHLRFVSLTYVPLMLTLVFIAGLASSLQAAVLVKHWKGNTINRSSNRWSVANSWEEGLVPADGDDLVFPTTSGALSTTNDIADLRAHNITIEAADFGIYGNAITLSGGISATHSSGSSTIYVAITNSANQTFRCATAGATLVINGDISMGATTLTGSGSGTVSLAGVIRGTGGFTKTGTGTNRMSGASANTYTGTTTVNQGTLELQKSSGIAIVGPVVIGNGTDTAVLREMASNLIGGVPVTVNEHGWFNLNGNSDGIGALTLRGGLVTTGAGHLTLGGDVTSLASANNASISGNLYLSGTTRTFDVADGTAAPDLTISAVVIDVGSSAGIIKTGPGVLILSGANGYTGPTTISNGLVIVDNATALGTGASGTTLAGGSLELDGVTINNEWLTNNSASSSLRILPLPLTSDWTGNIVLNADLQIDVRSPGVLNLSGVISGVGGINQTSDGTNRLSGGAANTYTGTTTVSAGTLELAKSSGIATAGPVVIGDGTGHAVLRELASNLIGGVPVRVNDGSVWFLNGNSDGIGALTLKGGQVFTGTGHLTLGGALTSLASSQSSGFVGNLYLGGTTRIVSVAAGPDPLLTITGVISDGGSSSGITKTGAGKLYFHNCVNTYSGLTSVSDGVLIVDSPAALGSSASGTVLMGGSLILEGVTIANEVLINNSASSSLEAMEAFSSNTSDWIGSIVLNADLNVVVPSDAVLYLSGVISGVGGMTKTQTGVFGLRGNSANTYTGTTTVRDGALEPQKTAGDAIPGPLVIGPGSNPLVLLVGNNQIGNVPVTVNAGGTLDLSLGFNDTIGALTLVDGAVMTGTGRLTLGGDLTASTLSSASTISGKLSLGSATRTINVANAPASSMELIISASVSGGGFIKTGAGAMRLSESNSYSGLTTVSSGLLSISNAMALGTTASGTVLAGGSLQLEGVYVSDESLTNNSATSSLVGLSTFFNSAIWWPIWASNVVLNADLNVLVYTNDYSYLSGVVSGNGGLIKRQSGLLGLVGDSANTYTGTTTVNEGVLDLNKNVFDGTILGPLVIGDGAGGVNADVVRVFQGHQLANTARVTVNSSGLLDVFGADDFGSLAGSGNVILESASASLLPGTDNTSTVFSGVISGAGGLYKRGTGTMTLTGNNNSYDATRIEAGTLLVNGSQSQIETFLYGGTLGGSGTVGTITSITPGGGVSPGASPGVLSSSDVTFSLNVPSTFTFELNGTTPGTGYDQLSVNGLVKLGNMVSLSATLGFPSAVGNAFTIIDNDSTEAVNNTFLGLPEGATLQVSGIPFRISYSGGTGNDVVLTQLMPLPTLAMFQTAITNFVFSWPTNYTGFTLESNTNLSSNVWAPVLSAPVLSVANYVVTNTTLEPQKFYRLRSP